MEGHPVPIKVQFIFFKVIGRIILVRYLFTQELKNKIFDLYNLSLRRFLTSTILKSIDTKISIIMKIKTIV
jgi:hypothetical protein